MITWAKITICYVISDVFQMKSSLPSELGIVKLACSLVGSETLHQFNRDAIQN